ncbi:type III PLP-dependent enzyme [Kitasatospora sp. A2-31]|uniref:type III PLP-dependent enzyme n=1 Tax=Kitasatospora sp. A2-31 TaxID=2916414 RepID=UPI001EE9E21E|nr:type III PLP-dependent enzyme [Kitasatospora sp. A2-31]MCG6498013.1 type III PLP-dependent enzyme [Kitasatospora sp. A2-31]
MRTDHSPGPGTTAAPGRVPAGGAPAEKPPAEVLRLAEDALAAELVHRYGSPLYVYDLDRVTRAAADLRAALPERARLYYSLKANPHPELVRTLRTAGCLPEICSTGELAAALSAGFEGADCLYGGPGKTAQELREALAAGVRTFSVESPADLRRVGAEARALGVTARCLLRINGTGAGAGVGLRMTGGASQFGHDIADGLPDLAEFTVAGTELCGLHFFPLTNAADPAGLLAEAVASIRTAAALEAHWGLPLRMLDLGGGFACPYAAPGERPHYQALREPLTAALDEHLPGWRERLELAFESGRYLVGDSGRLICTVTEVKESRGTAYGVLDSGINHLGGLSGVGRLPSLRAEPLRLAGSAAVADGAVGTRRVALVGPLCTPADVISRAAETVPPLAGDLLAVPNVGAYGATASLLGFLSRPAPVEVTVRDGRVVGADRLALRREPVPGHRTTGPVDHPTGHRPAEHGQAESHPTEHHPAAHHPTDMRS